MIAIDWGTSSLRGYLLDAQGRILEQRRSGAGILACQGQFAQAFQDIVQEWQGTVVLSGMIGSRNGWIELPYLPCPAGIPELADAIQPCTQLLEARTLWFVPGVATGTDTGVPDVMRGEETQLIGLLTILKGGTHTVCLPGTHSKWTRLTQGRLDRFATIMTGELYALLSQHSILGKLMEIEHAHVDSAAFAQGVLRSGEPGGLGHHLFGTRTLGLFEQLPAQALPSYLSGLLIGHEIRERQLPAGTPVHLIGSKTLTQRYVQALHLLQLTTWEHSEELAAHGLFALAQHRGLALN